MESGIELRMWIGVWIGMWNVGCGMWDMVCLSRLTPFVYKWGLGPLRDRSVARNRSNHLCALPKFTNGDDRTKKILQILVFANRFPSSKQLTQLVFERSASKAKNGVQIFFIFETISPNKSGFLWHFFQFSKNPNFFLSHSVNLHFSRIRTFNMIGVRERIF